MKRVPGCDHGNARTAESGLLADPGPLNTGMDYNLFVHGRGGYSLSIQSFDPATDVQTDLSGHSVFFEVTGTAIRTLCTADPLDPLAVVAVLSREDVETIPERATSFAAVDETFPLPVVLVAGTIQRTGYKGAPN